jgi:phospholipid transport system substrate-binding protein
VTIRVSPEGTSNNESDRLAGIGAGTRHALHPGRGPEAPEAIMQKALAMWLLLAASGGQPEVSPTQVVQTATDQVLQVVQDGQLAAPTSPERRRLEIQRIADRLFDFQEMSRRALARHWRDRTPQEQGEFVAVFKQLLGRAYTGRLESYAGEQIVYLGEHVDGEFATVRSKIVTGRGTEIPVDYRLHQIGARWAVYDVAVSGVSFVANYRGQFDRIIRGSSYQALMRDLKARHAEASVRGTGPVAIPAAAPSTKNP